MKHFFAAQKSIKTAARALFVALFVALGLSSCDNVSGGSPVVFIPPVIQPANPATPATAAPVANAQRATVTFCGSIGVGNALPQEVSAKVSALEASLGAVAGVSKAAQPDLEIGKEAEYYYYVSATPQDSVGNDPVEYGRNDNGEGGKFSGGSNGISYAIPLKVGKWIIECGIKNSQNKPVLRASSGLITLDESQSVVSRTFSAAPVSDAGNGSVLLTFNKGTADVDSAIARWKDSSGTEQSKTLERVMESDPAVWTGVLTLDLPSVAPGAYEMTISFYNNSDPSAANRTMVFQTVQTVSVFSGMKTNKWVTNGGTDKETGLITGDGFFISPAAVNVFRSSFLYVGDTGSTAPGYRGPSDSNEGSFLAPFATLQKAFNTIEASGSGEVDYTIYVCGSDAKPVKGNAVLRELLGDPSNKKAKSILITNVDGSTHAVIAGGGADEALNVISVLTDVPVKIRGVKITRDPANTTSRGININKAGASVTLLSGTEICGHASGTGYAGAGVHVEAGSLLIKGAKITDNHSQKNAGGVYVSNVGSATMESGEISSNSAPYGGGVSVESNNGSKGSFEMTGGTISGNTATSADGGGAVYVNGEFKISGNASIPYGGSVKSNDVALKDQNQQVIVDGSFYSSGKVATITPTVKTRGTPVLKKGSGEINADDCGRFGISSLGFNIKKSKQAGHLDLGVLSAPIYVSEGAGAQDSPNEEGTQTHPFKTLQYAVSKLSGGEPDTIFIDGTLEAKQTIPNTFIAGNCSALTIMGAGNLENGQIKDKKNPVDAIAIPSTGSAGSALEIKTSVPITIMNLKITGGNATAAVPNAYGGGIYLNSGGDVTLSDAALVTKNNAIIGGGVYVCNGAKLYLNGSAVIGDNGNLSAAATGSTAGANKAGDGAGIYNSGSVFLGYERGSDGNPKEAQLTGGVIGNYAESSAPTGAGISNSNMGVLKIASGKVSYNGVNVTGSADGKQGGGGVYNNGTVEMTGGEIVGNEASGTRCYGGGVLLTKRLNVSGAPNFTMTGGTISGNKAVGDNGYGGAVCEDVWDTDISFTMGGTASIPYGGTVKNNDVYLVSSNTTAATITIASAGFAENAPNTVATITLAKWKRKTNFLISTSSNVITGDHTKRFNFTNDNDGWERVIKSTDHKTAFIDSPIYVVSASDPDNKTDTNLPMRTRPEGFNKGKTSGATGTKTNPYATIAAALGCDDLTIAGRTITVAGTLGAQTIASGTSVSGGTSSPVTITGYRPVEGQPSAAQINGGGSATALSMAKSGLSTTIQYLTITDGKAENGGGINISDGTVTLSNFANVVGNKATTSGGGVYVTSGATLNISDYSEISDNMAASGATISGGGVYNEGTVTMTGGTISSNTATTGGAIYNKNSLTLNGAVSIPAGTGAGANDIAVYYDSSAATPAMKMVSAGASLSATASSIAITPTSWIRGKQVLTGTSSKYGCFKMSDNDWSIIQTSVSSTHAGKIDAPIYVCATGNETKGSSAATGYKTLAAAVAQCWLGPNDTDSTNGRIINISGTVTGAQTISSSIKTTTHATKITLQGTGTSPQLKGGFTSESKGTTLTVSTAVPVVVKSLTITGGYAASNGGGIDIEAGSVDLASGAVVSGNTATTSGGGVYVKSGTTLTVSAGTVQSNTAASGGAIYNAGTLNLTGTVSIPKGSGAGYNDIALFYDTSLTTPALKPVTVTSGFSTSSAILLTPTGYKRGKTAVSGATATQAGKFTLSDSEWSVLTDTGYIGKIDAPIYVAQADACAIDGVSYGGGKKPADGGLGTIVAPYDTIANAVAQCWNGPNDKTTTGSGANAVTVGRVINVVGTLEGSQTIGSGITTSDHASALTIKGVDSNAKFHAKGSSNPISIGKPLSIESAVPVALQNLTLMNGYHRTQNGGGIYVKAAGAKLTLGENVHVKNNKLAMTSGGSLGGGVYIEGTEANPATLIMNSNAEISNNKANQYNGSENTKGGGVYLKYANLCMSGTALIGMKNSTDPSASSSSSSSVNYAINGGGVYADTGSTVWLGYSEPDDSKKSDLTDGYGIRWNFGFKGGGGIYNNGGTVKMASGGVLYNATSNKDSDSTESDLYSGGGVYNGGTLSLTGGTVNGNKSDQGGGVYNNGSGAKIYMTGTALIGGSANGDATDATGNFAARYGGGVYNNGGYIYLGYTSSNSDGTPASTSATELANGIRQNYAYYKLNPLLPTNAALGGGIYSSEGKIYYNTGNISYNGAGLGAGIYLDYSTSGASLVMTGGTMASNKAGTSGGAVSVMSNGTGSAAATTKSSFSLSGSATSIASTGNKNNDIYLYYDCSVTVAGTLGAELGARIFSAKTEDGTLVLSPQSSSATDVSYVTDNFKKFAHNTKYIQSNGALFSNQSAQNITTTTSSGTFGVATQADLNYVATTLSSGTNGLSGVTLKLADDVELDSTWSGIGSSSKKFKGNFDGNYKTVNFTSAKAGLINYASGSTVSKLKTTGTVVPTSGPMGVLVGSMDSGTVQLCANYASLTYTSGGRNYFGGIVGNCDGSSSNPITIDMCKNWAAIRADGENYGTGGVVGYAKYTTVKNCENRGAVTNNKSGSYGGIAGGIVGETSSSGSGLYILNCANNATITSTGLAGGILGGRGYGTIKNSWVSCTVTSSKGEGGGISGTTGQTMNNCYVKGPADTTYIYPNRTTETGCTVTQAAVSTLDTSLNAQATANSWKQWGLYDSYFTIDSGDTTWNSWMINP